MGQKCCEIWTRWVLNISVSENLLESFFMPILLPYLLYADTNEKWKKKLYLASCISPNKQWSQYLVHVCKIRLSRESFLFFENLVFSNCCGRGDFKGQKMTKMIKHVYICSHKHPTTYPMIICVTHFVEWGFKFIFEKCVSLLARRLGEKARKW